MDDGEQFFRIHLETVIDEVGIEKARQIVAKTVDGAILLGETMEKIEKKRRRDYLILVRGRFDADE